MTNSTETISENRDGSKAAAHYVRAMLVAAKQPEQFPLPVDPIGRLA